MARTLYIPSRRYSINVSIGPVLFSGIDCATEIQIHFRFLYSTGWKLFRRDAMTAFLQEATTQCHNVDSNLDVGGYVLPFPAHPGGFDTFQGQGNNFTRYHPFGFRILPMIYWQDWASPGSFGAWTKEKVFYSVRYSTDSPPVWPTFSITDTDWCGNSEICHCQHVVEAFLTAANSGKDSVGYGSRTVEMFFYDKWGKVEWDRLSYALSTANEIISNGAVAPTPSPDPNDCTHFVPCGYTSHTGKDSPGKTLYISGTTSRMCSVFDTRLVLICALKISLKLRVGKNTSDRSRMRCRPQLRRVQLERTHQIRNIGPEPIGILDVESMLGSLYKGKHRRSRPNKEHVVQKPNKEPIQKPNKEPHSAAFASQSNFLSLRGA